MFERLERRNREVWEGHSRILEDVTHVIGGIGVGLLLYPILRRQAKPLAWSLLLLSTALHAYADTVEPSGKTRARRLETLSGGEI
jgi:hypothetical protein